MSKSYIEEKRKCKQWCLLVGVK